MPFMALKGVGTAAANTLERATLDGQKYLSAEDLQAACGAISSSAKNNGSQIEYGTVSGTVMETLAGIGALGNLPRSSQVSLFE